MKVQARHQFAYKGKFYGGGDIFEIDKDDYERIKSDVYVVGESVTKKRKTKPVKGVKTK